MTDTFQLGRSDDGARWIKCLQCNRVSYHPDDIEKRYCGYCRQFHAIMAIEPPPGEAYVIWSCKRRAWWAPIALGYVQDLSAAGRFTQEKAGEYATGSILLDSIAIHESVAQQKGPPKFHPYNGSGKE